ncbi:Protein dpy-19 like protein 3 [Chelonia mydas]|uniref:Protein dpy-19 like protein 3 n=1 Tax=Chelonia mydas TaxID=8469 RepID=M7C8H7_CHEMY|nr:Protein dpy-19 like protein 3 [Chelonia mydas]
MNVYQELFLSILYRILPIQNYLEPVYFYIYTLFGLQALYVIALYVTSWLLSGTWLSGLLAAFWYITNRIDTTRVEFTIPLRENWALPFFAVQIAAITYLFRSHLRPLHEKILNLESDEHIFKFLKAKFGFGTTRDFDANLYLCEEAFGLLPFNTFARLSDTLLFYAYLFVLLLMAAAPAVVAFQNLRMKYLWTSHMCVFASFGLCSTEVWGFVLKSVHLYTPQRFCPGMMDELSELREFYDPDTVELMNWIKSNTPKKAVIAGSMQLLAGVKLCTGRILTNHPHYEDKSLRERTKQVYQVYAKRSPEDVYSILKSFGTNYVILEDSICYERRHSRGCRLRDLLDIANGHIMDGLGENEPDLKASLYPRFCEEIKKNLSSYSMYFTRVFQNKTFHVYKLAKHK